MKQPMINSGADRNWSWPEKTWFQERLSAIKTREQGLRRKPMVTASRPATMVAKAEGDNEPVKIESRSKP
jgi:hypothetical protein